MTMLSVVSVPEGIVLSADSSESNGRTYRDKIFADYTNNIAFMLYNNSINFMNFQIKYSHKDSVLIKNNKDKLNSTKINKFNSPIDFVRHMIKNGEIPDCRELGVAGPTGVVVAGYEENIPKLYTFVRGIRKINYKPKGSDNSNYCEIPSRNSCKVEEEEIPCGDRKIRIHCFKNYFGVCFSTIDYISHYLYQYQEFGKMSLNEAVDFSRQLIKHTIEEIRKEKDKSVDYPIDTLIITQDGIIWNRNPKESDNGKNYINRGNVGNLNV